MMTMTSTESMTIKRIGSKKIYTWHLKTYTEQMEDKIMQMPRCRLCGWFGARAFAANFLKKWQKCTRY